jgi:hypothetical protein
VEKSAAESGLVYRERGTLATTFLDRRSSVPLAGAQVMCVGRDRAVTQLTTDASGTCRIEMAEGPYDLVVSARGYLSLLLRGIGVLGGYEHLFTRALVPGDDRAVHDVAPATAIGGYAVDRNGHGVNNVIVQAIAGDVTKMTRTDKRGAYLLHSVEPETYEIVFRAPDRVFHRGETAITDIRAFARYDVKLLHL